MKDFPLILSFMIKDIYQLSLDGEKNCWTTVRWTTWRSKGNVHVQVTHRKRRTQNTRAG